MIDLYFLISAINACIFDLPSELAISTGTPFNKANAKIEKQQLAAEN